MYGKFENEWHWRDAQFMRTSNLFNGVLRRFKVLKMVLKVIQQVFKHSSQFLCEFSGVISFT